MVNGWFFYWADMLDTLRIIFLCVGGLGFVFIGAWNLVSQGEDRIKSKWIICCVVTLFLGALLPSKKTMYMAAGVEIVEEIAKNEDVRNISDKTLEVINLYLENTKNELEKNSQ